MTVASRENATFQPVTWDQNVSPNHYYHFQYHGLSHLPSLYIRGQEMEGLTAINAGIDGHISTSLAEGTPVDFIEPNRAYVVQALDANHHVLMYGCIMREGISDESGFEMTLTMTVEYQDWIELLPDLACATIEEKCEVGC